MAKRPLSMQIAGGIAVIVRDSLGRSHEKIATSEREPGLDGPIVWACRPEEWKAAEVEGREPISVPWPAEDVRPA